MDGTSLSPIRRPRVGADDPAFCAHHPRAERRHPARCPARLGTDNRLIVTRRACNRERPHAMLAHVAEPSWARSVRWRASGASPRFHQVWPSATGVRKPSPKIIPQYHCTHDNRQRNHWKRRHHHHQRIMPKPCPPRTPKRRQQPPASQRNRQEIPAHHPLYSRMARHSPGQVLDRKHSGHRKQQTHRNHQAAANTYPLPLNPSIAAIAAIPSIACAAA